MRRQGACEASCVLNIFFDGEAFQAESDIKHTVFAPFAPAQAEINYYYPEKIVVGGGGRNMGMIRGDRGVGW